MSYEIPVPYRDREQPLVDVRSELRDAPLDEPRPTSRARSSTRPCFAKATARPAICSTASITPMPISVVRSSTARVAAIVLDSVAEVERRRDLAHARRDDIPPPPSRRRAGQSRDAQGRAWQSCPAQSCKAVPTDHVGQVIPSRAIRWWCPVHRDQAAPGDLADWEPPVLVFGSAGLEQPLTAADKEYYRELHEQREQDQAERNARRQREAEAIEAARERYLREHGGPDIMGVPASKVRVDP